MIQNPITSKVTPDPYVCYDAASGHYYGACTLHEPNGRAPAGDAVLKVFRAKRARDVFDGECVTVWREGDAVCGDYTNVWAPELFHNTDGKWYLITSGFHEKGPVWSSLRIFLLRSRTGNPFDGFDFVREFDELSHAFDPTLYRHADERLYLAYTQVMYPFGFKHYEQRLFIREMRSPAEPAEKFAELSRAERPFELSSPNERINEGPFFLAHGGKLFLIYSANGAGNKDYCLGVLEHIGGELCDAASWRKLDAPMLYKSDELMGTGHAAFFPSPDGREVWCSFHASPKWEEGKIYQDRFACLCRVGFDENDRPVIGAARSTELSSPAGE